MQISNYFDFDITVSDVDLALTKKCPLHWEFENDSRAFFGLVYMLSGSAIYTFQDRIEYAQANDIIFLQKGDCYSIKAISDAQLGFIVLSFDVENDTPLPFPTVNRVSHTKRFLEMFSYIEEVRFAKGIGYKLFCRSMVEQLIYHLLMEHLHTTKATQNMQASIEYIENCYDKKIEIETLAKISGISASHYRRKFKEIYGVSPNEYINRLRIEKAKDMLRSNLFSQSEIASLCGFENVYYFSRVFKKFADITPGEY